MSSSGKLVGIILVVAGILVFLGGSAISIFSTIGAGEQGSLGGAVLGTVIALIVAIPLVGGGIILMVRAQSDASRQADANRQRKILDMVKTRGQVDIGDLVIELNSTTGQVRDDIYKLVGMGLFTGYVNWSKGTLYSREASQLTGQNCPNCGGEQSFGGKGVITCQYCGTDVFL